MMCNVCFHSVCVQALLPTRRWFNTVLDDSHLVVSCHLSSLMQREKEGHLFCQLLDMLKFYTGFEINDQTGNALTEKEMTTLHYDRITSLQVHAYNTMQASILFGSPTCLVKNALCIKIVYLIGIVVNISGAF